MAGAVHGCRSAQRKQHQCRGGAAPALCALQGLRTGTPRTGAGACRPMAGSCGGDAWAQLSPALICPPTGMCEHNSHLSEKLIDRHPCERCLALPAARITRGVYGCDPVTAAAGRCSAEGCWDWRTGWRCTSSCTWVGARQRAGWGWSRRCLRSGGAQVHVALASGRHLSTAAPPGSLAA